MSEGKLCDHKDAQVGLRLIEIEVDDPDEVDRHCDWCEGIPDILLVKSERHSLVFCEECRDIIRIVAGGSNGE